MFSLCKIIPAAKVKAFSVELKIFISILLFNFRVKARNLIIEDDKESSTYIFIGLVGIPVIR